MAALLMLGLIGALTCALPARAETRTPRTAAPVYLVMDVSGSMEGDKLKAAKRAALAFIDNLQPRQKFALYTFPSTSEQSRKLVDGCPAGHFQIRPGSLRVEQAKARVSSLQADGETPTVPALKEIMRSADEQGFTQADVVLFTDGEANCGESTDVCDIAPALAQRGLNLRISTVSLGTSDEVDAQLGCLSSATGGKNVNIDNLDDLVDAFARASTYVVDLNVEIPAQLFSVTGRASSLAGSLMATVTAAGSTVVPDAKLVVTFNSGNRDRFVNVPKPIVTLGNLEMEKPRAQIVAFYPYAKESGSISWTVSVVAGSGLTVAKQSGQVQVSASGTGAATGGTILTSARSVVVLGDSYSSGEGAGDYTTGACHRSAHAYGRVLFADAEILACSGAVTGNLWVYDELDDVTLAPQLEELLNTTTDGTPPDLVMMTFGGNDVGFADAIANAVQGSSRLPERSSEEWASLRNRLVNAYRAVNAVVNDPTAMAARRGTPAQILVLAYPIGIPSAGRGGCFLGISQTEMAALYAFGVRVNQEVEGAVGEANSQNGVPIQYVSTVEQAFQPNHTACDEDTYLNTTRDLGKVVFTDQQLMHPNDAGQRAEASSVVEWSRSHQAVPLTKLADDYRDITVTSYVTIQSDSPLTVGQHKLGQPYIPIPSPNVFAEPGSSLNGSTACPNGICNWAQGPLSVTLHSIGNPLGTLTVLKDGTTPNGQIVIPFDVEPGAHTLVFTGLSDTGVIQTVQIPLRIWRPGANWGFCLAVAGLMLTLAAGALWVAAQRGLRRQKKWTSPSPPVT